MNFLISLRSEILKTKRTTAFYFTLVGAAVIPLIFLMNVSTEGLPDNDKGAKEPLNAIFKLTSEMTGLAIFPFFIVLVCTLIPQVEHRNNTWKQVLASPQTKATVFGAKFLSIHLLIILFLAAHHLFTWVVAIAAHFLMPELNVLSQPLDMPVVLLTIFHSYVTLLAVTTIQFWIGLRFKGFIVPIAIGLAMWFTGMLLALEYRSELANYFPYSFQVFNFSSTHKPLLNQIEWTSLGYAVFFLIAGFVDFKRMRISG